MTITMPISAGPNDVYVFVDVGDRVDAARLAITENGAFIAFPEADFAVGGLLPLHPHTGQPLPGLRWAATADVAETGDLFPQP